MKSLTHKLTLVLLAMSIVPLVIAVTAWYGLRTAGSSLDQNDQTLQNLSTLLNSAGHAIHENAGLQENANRVASDVARSQEEISRAMKRIDNSILPKMFVMTRIRLGLRDVSMAERALLLAYNMRHQELDELETAKKTQTGYMNEAMKHIDEARQEYLKYLDSPTEGLAWDELLEAIEEWQANHNEFLENVASLDKLTEDLVRGGPLFESATRKAYETIFVSGRAARDLCEKRIDALNNTLAQSTTQSVATAVQRQEQANLLLSDLEKETATAASRSGELEEQIESARLTAHDAAATAGQALAATSSRFRRLVFIAVAGIALALAAGILIVRRISMPVRHVAASMARLSQGDLSEDLPPKLLKGKDEVGQLSRAMQELITASRDEIGIANAIAEGDYTVPVPLRCETDQLGLTLRTMLNRSNDALVRVGESVLKVSQGADQISEASQSLSRGAQTSASALEEITQSVQNVDGQAKDNASRAREANSLATASRDAARRGYDAVRDLVAAMAEIQAEGKRIASVAKLIDDIAFQTNLLALNAAVEAARAGRYGKGFSVVADEVRNLSGRSAKAARDTGNMVAAMNERMQAGMEMAEKSDVEFREIVDATVQVAGIFNSITEASNAQSLATTQIAGGLEQIDEVIQENTHNAEATAQSAEWLLRQAGELRRSVSKFKLMPRRPPLREPVHESGREPVREPARIAAGKTPAMLPLSADDGAGDEEGGNSKENGGEQA